RSRQRPRHGPLRRSAGARSRRRFHRGPQHPQRALDRRVDQPLALEPGELRPGDEQRDQSMDRRPDRLGRQLDLRAGYGGLTGLAGLATLTGLPTLPALRALPAGGLDAHAESHPAAHPLVAVLADLLAAAQALAAAGRRHEGELVVMRMLEPEVDVGAQAGGEALARRQPQAVEALGVGPEAGEALLADAVQDLGLVAEMDVDGHRRVADAPRDLAQRDAGIALADEQLPGGLA